MKTGVFIFSLMSLIMISCNSDEIPIIEEEEEIIEEESTLLLSPTDAVQLTGANETFTVDFTPGYIFLNYRLWIETFKTRDAIIDQYKSRSPSRKTNNFLYDYEIRKDHDLEFLEYVLAQECFSDDCDSETRMGVLQLVVEKQKLKVIPELKIYHYASVKSGIFLMGVILLKEYEDSAKFIDAETLQEALLILRIDEDGYKEFDDFEDYLNYHAGINHLYIECSEQFLRLFFHNLNYN